MASTEAPDELHLKSEQTVKECYKDLLSFIFAHADPVNLTRGVRYIHTTLFQELIQIGPI